MMPAAVAEVIRAEAGVQAMARMRRALSELAKHSAKMLTSL
jgi:hypothetical protein